VNVVGLLLAYLAGAATVIVVEGVVIEALFNDVNSWFQEPFGFLFGS